MKLNLFQSFKEIRIYPMEIYFRPCSLQRGYFHPEFSFFKLFFVQAYSRDTKEKYVASFFFVRPYNPRNSKERKKVLKKYIF